MKAINITHESLQRTDRDIHEYVEQKLKEAGFDLKEPIHRSDNFEKMEIILWQDERIDTTQITGLVEYEQ